MPTQGRPLSQAEFDRVYSLVPRLTVEVILRDDQDRVLLTLRDSGRCAGRWHIPGGTVRFAEHLTGAVERIGRDKLGIGVTGTEHAGFIEYPSHLAHPDWPVGAVFAVKWDGTPSALPLSGASDARWFAAAPAGMHDEQAAFLGWPLPPIDPRPGIPGRVTHAQPPQQKELTP